MTCSRPTPDKEMEELRLLLIRYTLACPGKMHFSIREHLGGFAIVSPEFQQTMLDAWRATVEAHDPIIPNNTSTEETTNDPTQ